MLKEEIEKLAIDAQKHLQEQLNKLADQPLYSKIKHLERYKKKLIKQERDLEEKTFVLDNDLETQNLLNSLQENLVRFNKIINLSYKKLFDWKLEKIKNMPLNQQLLKLQELKVEWQKELEEKENWIHDRTTRARFDLWQSQAIEDLMEELDNENEQELKEQITAIQNLHDEQQNTLAKEILSSNNEQTQLSRRWTNQTRFKADETLADSKQPEKLSLQPSVDNKYVLESLFSSPSEKKLTGTQSLFDLSSTTLGTDQQALNDCRQRASSSHQLVESSRNQEQTQEELNQNLLAEEEETADISSMPEYL